MTNRPSVVLLAALIVLLASIPGGAWQQGAPDAPGPELRGALANLQRGDFQAAEKKLRAEISAHPGNPWALSMLGAALDNLNRTSEADIFHRRAIAEVPRSTGILNNYATHLWLSGDPHRAGGVYRRIVALDPSHYSANLQLARLALQEKNGAEALRCLDRIPAGQRETPPVLLPRLEALYLSGDRSQADALAAHLFEMSAADPNLGFALGVALSNARQFAKAESLFESALRSSPSNFSVLYDLGVAATGAGHNDRAREVLEAALRQQPQNVDVLYALACADHALKRWETAVQLLSQAAKLDPRRADVQKMLAIAAGDLGALDDAAAAWDRYLQIQPNDAIARRERGYTAAQMGKAEIATADLEWYIGKQPGDPVGYYELAQAERSMDIDKAMRHLDHALDLDPKYVPARTARGSLYYQQGNPGAAVKDLEIASSLRPDDAAALDRLGQAYQALDRTADALRVLRKAAALAPNDSRTLLHFARALADSGNTVESRAVMERFRQLGPEKRSAVPGGFVAYLSLSEGERHAEHRRRLEKALQLHPKDAALRLEYLKLLLADGNFDRVGGAVQDLVGVEPSPVMLADAGHALLEAKQYTQADRLLQLAEAAAPSPAVELDLSNSAFRQGDAGRGLALLDRIPESSRSSDYYLSRAEMLDASGKSAEALQTLERSSESGWQSPDSCRRAAAFLIRRNQQGEAVNLLGRAARALPENREILLLRAGASELAGQSDDAERTLAAIQERWPEWQTIWAAHGMVLAMHRHFDDGRKALETAVALGATSPGVYYYLAECALTQGEAGRSAANSAIGSALQEAPQDPWIRVLAGRIARGERPEHDPRAREGPPYLFQLVFAN